MNPETQRGLLIEDDDEVIDSDLEHGMLEDDDEDYDDEDDHA